MPAKDYDSFCPGDRKAWRKWLEENHLQSPGIWLIYYKKSSGKPTLPYADAVEEALCFGWIDSLPRKLDQHRAMLKFTPRKPKSVWSDLNKMRVERLINDGLMTAAGLRAIELAKKNGSWETLNSTNYQADNNKLPADLVTALSKNKKALAHFNAFTISYKRQFLFWIDSAKKPATRNARIQQTALMAAANKKPGKEGFKL